MIGANKATTMLVLGSGSTFNGVAYLLPLRIVASTGQITQVRNHVKIYPWRFNRQNRECYLDPTKTPYTDRFNINEFNHNKKRKDWQKVIPKDKDNRFNSYKWNDAYKSDPKEAKETAQSKMNRFRNSLRDRGSARECRPYNPPEDVQDKVLSLFRSSKLTESIEQQAAASLDTDDIILALDLTQTKALKINLISLCIKLFNHDMPSSYLDEMKTVSNVVEYFSTPVREPLRYNREQDQFFKGYTAMPGVISKIPGLRASKKYPILNQNEFQWPDI